MRERAPTKVLIVDREGAAYGLLAGPLTRAGLELTRASSAAEAVALAQKGPQAVVINFTMRERVGDQAFLRLRSDEAAQSIPIVFLIDPRHWGRRAHDAAADALVPCPWAPQRVLSAIHRVVTGGPGLNPRGVRPLKPEAGRMDAGASKTGHPPAGAGGREEVARARRA